MVTASNSTDKDIDFNPYSVSVVDGEGFTYYSGYGNRDDADRTDRPDFSESVIPAGGAISGWVFYQVINDAEPAWVIYNDSFGTQQFGVLANLQGVTIADGDEIAVYDASADEVGSVSIDEIVTSFEDLDSAVQPARGMTAIGVVATITNTSSTDLELNNYNFYLVDDFGFQYYPNFYFRSEESTTQYPDFTNEPVPADSSVTGLLTYEIPSDAGISYITYTPDYQQLYIVAQPGEGSTVSGDTLTPVAVPTGDEDVPTEDTGDEPVDEPTDEAVSGGNETGDCVGVADWITSANDALDAFDDPIFTETESLADVDTDDLRTGADTLRDAADELESIDAPEAAQNMEDAIVAAFNTYADIFDDAAERIDNGEDPADVEASLEDDPEFAAAFGDLFTEITNLGTICPDSGVENLG